jgi:hypothetical protein
MNDIFHPVSRWRSTLTIAAIGAALLATGALAACSAPPESAGQGLHVEEDDRPRRDAGAASEEVVLSASTCFCPGEFACGRSTSPSQMYPAARTALGAAGVPTTDLLVSYEDTPELHGTHCIDNGTSYSATTDLREGANPCERAHRLRQQGFAAWFRTAPEFPDAPHIHAVYAGAASTMNDDKKQEVEAFLRGGDGLADEKQDEHCPITQEEIRTVREAFTSAGAGSPTENCVPGGSYCGGGEVSGDSSTLYRCNGDGSATLIKKCGNGCRVNPGANDSCNSQASCVTGSTYCGGDKIDGDPSVLYRCDGGGTVTVVAKCTNGCSVNPGKNDSCR